MTRPATTPADPAAPMRLADITPDTPLRLSVAAELAFPGGNIKATTLRRNAQNGLLAIERIGGKDFVTLAAIAEMRKRCQLAPKAPAYGSAHLEPATIVPKEPSGSSATESISRARDAVLATMQRLKGGSPHTSHQSTRRNAENVTLLKSRSPT